jgi:small-conductance mechanosensitive channel
MSTYPVVYQQKPPVDRNRLTVFFRLIMLIPQWIWICFYGLGALVVVFCAWFAILVTGRYPEGMYNFVAGFLRYSTRVNAYSYLLVDRYPPFDGGEHPEYPVAVSVAPPPAQLSRLTTFFRGLLFIPVYIVVYVFTIWIEVVSIALWFVAVITGKTPPGLSDAIKFPMAYIVRASAYGLLLTDGFPPFED